MSKKQTVLDLERKDDYLNRHLDGLPKNKCNVLAIITCADGERVMLCEWIPFNSNDPTKDEMLPSQGYLGTIKVIENEFNGIGFHAWEQNNSEFVHYKIVQNKCKEIKNKWIKEIIQMCYR